MRGIAREDVARATAVAKAIAMTLKNGGGVEVASSETVNEWADRWVKARIAKGLTSTRHDVGRYTKWVAPIIGTTPMTDVSPADIERIVRGLDEAVRASARAGDGKFKWKTAVNVWGVVTKMFADACRSKVTELRVRADNPTRDVEGPDRGIERSGAYLFPSEFVALIECDRVPVRWRRLFILSTYLYVRVGELEALEWSAVNFDQGYVHVHQAIDADTGETKSTKTKDARKVPIEPTLMPLLVEMHREAKGEGRIVTAMPPRESLAERLRRYLEWAGVTRADLFANDETRRPLTWHDLRHTGITWRSMRGDDPLKVQRAAGHDDLRTTQRYINEAQTFEADFGEVFPAFAKATLSPFPGASGFGEELLRNSGVSEWSLPNSEAILGTSERPQRDSKPLSPEEFRSLSDVSGIETPEPIAAESPPSPPSERETDRPVEPPKDDLDEVERALAFGIAEATKAAQWSTVAALAGELSARRMAKAGNVIPIRPKAKSSP